MHCALRRYSARPACVLSLVLALATAGLSHAIEEGQQRLFDIVDLRSAGKTEDAMSLCRQVIQDFAGTKYEGWARLYLGEIYGDLRQEEPALQEYTYILANFGDPRLLSKAAWRKSSLLVHRLQDYDGAIEFIQQQLTDMGDLLSWSERAGLVINMAQAHDMAGRPEDAVAAYKEWLPLTPGLLSNNYYWEHLFALLAKTGASGQLLSTVRAAYALCPYDQTSIEAMSNLVKKAYAARGEIFSATQFFAAQEDPEQPNPLLDVPMPQLTEEQIAQMVRSAQADARLRVSTYLYVEDYANAMLSAQEAMAEADASQMLQALNEVARVFKAKDLNLVRANQFLEYAKTGQGVNPLDGFWEEVQQ